MRSIEMNSPIYIPANELHYNDPTIIRIIIALAQVNVRVLYVAVAFYFIVQMRAHSHNGT